MDRVNIEIKSESFTPRRSTFSHIARRYGEDRPASRYDEATLDVQATVNFHYRPLWAPEFEIFDTRRTAVVMEDWYTFSDPRQYYYATYNINRANMNAAADRAFEFVEDRDLVARIEPAWLDTVRHYLVPLRHVEWAADLNSLRITDYGYGTRVTSAAMFAASDRLGMAQLLTRIGLVLDGNDEAGLEQARTAWLEAADWQPMRRMTEDTLVIEDWFETFIAQYLAADGVVHPLVYGTFDDAGLEHGATAVSMMCEFMVDWMKDNARWVDALVQVAAQESADNADLISGWYRTWRDRAVEAAEPLAQTVLGATDAVQTIRDGLDARATSLGLSA
jgi:phenol/toluene 2-monooxygenase (NADH) P1/A1